jgi:hypothetical protein
MKKKTSCLLVKTRMTANPTMVLPYCLAKRLQRLRTPKKHQLRQRRKFDRPNLTTPMLTRNCGFSKTSCNSVVRYLWKTMKRRYGIQEKPSRVSERPRQRMVDLRTYTLPNRAHQERQKQARQTICQRMLSCGTCKSQKPHLFRLCRLHARKVVSTPIRTMNCLLSQLSNFPRYEPTATFPVSPLETRNLPSL